MSMFEFTALSESALSSGNIKPGSTFVVPDIPTATFIVTDDDGSLSGDRDDMARDATQQTASIQDGDGGELGNGGAIYAEVWFWVVDEDGNRYRMIEIEQEGGAEDYFTFIDDGAGVPGPGAILTVESRSNVTGDWVDYLALGAGSTAAPEPTPEAPEPDLAPAPSPAVTISIDAVDDAIAVGEDVDIVDDDAGGVTGVDALNVLGNDVSSTGTFTITDVAALGVQDPGLDPAVGVTFTVTSEGGRQGQVTLEADGDLLFDGGTNFEDLNTGQTDRFQLAYTIETQQESVDTVVFDPVFNPEGPDRFAIIIDEDMIDNGTSTVESAAAALGVTPDELVNDNNPVEVGNPPLLWNQLADAIGTTVRLPTGQAGDEGLFALPANPVGKEGAFTVEDFVDGIVPQSALDEVRDVNPLNNSDLEALVGQSFVGIVYDSDVSINYDPLQANLQGARYGQFYFTVVDVVPAGGLPESGSSSSLNDLIVRIDAVPQDPFTVATVQDLLKGTDFNDAVPDFEIDINPPLGDAEIQLDFADVAAAGGTIAVFAGSTQIATATVPAGTSTVTIPDADGATRIEIELAADGTLVEARADVSTIETVSDTAEVTVLIEGEDEPVGSISGRYWCDENGDAVEQSTEEGIFGAPVTLERWDGTAWVFVAETTTSGTDATYQFSDLVADTYRVVFGPEVGKEFVQANVGQTGTTDVADDSDVEFLLADGSGATAVIDLAAGENRINVDAGAARPVSRSP